MHITKKIYTLVLSILLSTLIQASTNITLPSVPTPTIPPTVIKAIILEGSINTSRAIQFSKRVPPNYIAHRLDNPKESNISNALKIGEVVEGRISAYLRGDFLEVSLVEERLQKAGFTILSSSPVNKKATLISVVFTNSSLIAMASKPNRGFVATLRILVDTKDKNINITNPLYITKGFLQDDFDEKASKLLLKSLVNAFPKLRNSKDALKFQLLAKYVFMKSMPHYENMIEVASGDDLLERIKDNKKVVFTQKLNNNTVLIGIKLSKRTRKFSKKIGRSNAGMLPYPIIIENGKAKILDPKYYLSYMYPLLTMSEFMTIATIPDAMVKDCKRVFRKKKKK
jgi:hypothetical protein